MAQLPSVPFGRVEETEITAISSSRKIQDNHKLSIQINNAENCFTYRKQSLINIPVLSSLSVFTRLG